MAKKIPLYVENCTALIKLKHKRLESGLDASFLIVAECVQERLKLTFPYILWCDNSSQNSLLLINKACCIKDVVSQPYIDHLIRLG